MKRRKPPGETASSTSTGECTDRAGAAARAGRTRDSVREAKAHALADVILRGPYYGELALTGVAYEHLHAVGLARGEVHRSVADLEASGPAIIVTTGSSVVVRLVGAAT